MTIGTHKTTVYQNERNMTAVRYHQTEVVQFDGNKVILDSGGWHSATTKKRMNQVSETHGLGFTVYQKNFEWLVDFHGTTIPFTDGMTLNREH